MCFIEWFPFQFFVLEVWQFGFFLGLVGWLSAMCEP